ncbi:hypothetical protein V8C37DRAFT_6785 [Trichoderma ceciliae]
MAAAERFCSLPIPTAPSFKSFAPSILIVFSCWLRDKLPSTEQIPRTANLCYGASQALQGCLTHGDLFVRQKRPRPPSLSALTGVDSSYSYKYNQEKGKA